MSDDLLSLRLVVVSNSTEDRDLFRQAASSVAVPVEIVTADSAASAKNEFSAGADILYVDSGLATGDRAQTIAAARTVRKSPFTVLPSGKMIGAEPFEADALASKPARPDEAKQLIERSIRVRLPSRVLVVDDSSTMRSIVRKLLAATRFPLDVSEADEGIAALKLVHESGIDLVFLDYNMPGLSGLETIAEFKREKRRVFVVLMTSQPDGSLAARAREHGAAFLKKPFFPADIDAVLCHFYGLRALSPTRA
jgi:CheY-like chemotaxis protein